MPSEEDDGDSALRSPIVDAQIGARLSDLRKQAQITIDALATSLQVLEAQVEDWEAGRTRIPPARLIEITTVLGCKLPDLFEGLPEADRPATASEQLDNALSPDASASSGAIH